ncbi:uncharacterized protein TRUGW13939_10423 [Talaromyces rugulosus]|uniref:Zn(2)-C6 fungal-type domain-containing protein n=1 Tax=Talaromyces rugulosus TaxID=121627 RepID=A0A7H8RA05_TALRU|nr:uncharacterized protein TRUGW13939_10423 [Talaromyces rugulosus]QKX63254.1 hypothetical protein TRUGW13939_10423 [Talaromyces rugulosus]
MPRSQKNPTGSSGRSGPKVKSGCRTCKIRKVKCDEGKPSCYRCSSSSRVCDGYGVWGGDGHLPSRNATQTGVKLAISRNKTRPRNEKYANSKFGQSESQFCDFPLGCTGADMKMDNASLSTTGQWEIGPVPMSLVEFPAAAHERGVFFWFQQYTVNKIPGLFSFKFWSSLLPRACYSEPAILHAVLALTSAHKYEQLETTSSLSTDEKFTLEAYGKAIHCLRTDFGLKSNTSLKVILIACIVFVCLEIVQQHHATAITHLANGLRLIEQLERSLAAEAQPLFDHHEPEGLIFQMFLRLKLQVNMLGYCYDFSSYINNSLSAYRIPGRFLSMLEARKYMDILISRAFELEYLFQKACFRERAERGLKDNQISLRSDLDLWLQAFISSFLQDKAASNNWNKVAYNILRMYHDMAYVMAETCLSAHQEMLFDYQVERFLSILTYAINTITISAGLQEPILPEATAKMQKSIVDIGWIPVLYYTATRCRVARIRLHAIRILELTSHREGMWDARVAAQVAQEVMRIEEAQDPYQSCLGDTFTLEMIPKRKELKTPTLGASQRVSNIQVIPPDEPWGMIGFMCRKKHNNSNWEVIWKENDPISGMWLDVV